MYPQSVLSKNMKIYKKKHLKIIIFTAVKYCSILHGHICVMRRWLVKSAKTSLFDKFFFQDFQANAEIM